MNSSYMYCNTYFSLIGTELLLLHNKLLCVVLSQLIYFFQMFIFWLPLFLALAGAGVQRMKLGNSALNFSLIWVRIFVIFKYTVISIPQIVKWTIVIYSFTIQKELLWMTNRSSSSEMLKNIVRVSDTNGRQTIWCQNFKVLFCNSMFDWESQSQ